MEGAGFSLVVSREDERLDLISVATAPGGETNISDRGEVIRARACTGNKVID